MSRIIIAKATTGQQTEVDQATFNAGYFPGWVYVRDASGGPSTNPLAPFADDMDQVLADPTSAPSARLKAAYVPKWAPSTAYKAATDLVLNPSGQIVQPKADFTSGMTYDATKWTIVSGGGSTLAPTATKTTAYAAAVGDLAMMNVSGGATTLTLPAAPADKAQVAYRAIGATAAVPLTVTRGGTDSIGTAGATSVSVVLTDETVVLQYDAANTRWLAIAEVAPKSSLDAVYEPAGTANGILTGFVQGGPTIVRSLTTVYDDHFSFPPRLRPVETSRRVIRVRNTGPNALQLGYGTAGNNDYNGPGTWTWTVNPGQEWIDTSGSYRALFAREAVNGSPFTCTVYSEAGVA